MEPLFHLEGMAVQEIGDENEFDAVQLSTLVGRLLAGAFIVIVLAVAVLALGYASGAGLALLLPGLVDHHTDKRRLFITPLAGSSPSARLWKS